MTMDELKKMCAQSREQGLKRLYIYMKFKKHPRSESIRVAGFGNGTVLGVSQHADGSYHCSCSFSLNTVEKNIMKHEMGKKFK